MTTIKHKTG